MSCRCSCGSGRKLGAVGDDGGENSGRGRCLDDVVAVGYMDRCFRTVSRISSIGAISSSGAISSFSIVDRSKVKTRRPGGS